MEFDNLEAVRNLAVTPLDPPKREGRGIWGSAWDSLKAKTFLGPAASALEVAQKPKGPQSTWDIVKPEFLRFGDEFPETERSAPLRASAKALEPDMATATTSEKLVFGFVGPAVNLVGGALAGGPAGLALAAGEAGFSQSEELRKQKVKTSTRTGVAMVTTAVTTAGGLLPIVGPTIGKTVGLWAVGGPGAFMAQQQATRSILEAADYADIAKQFDPLDVTGLLVSGAPGLVFAGPRIVTLMKAGKPAKASAAGPVAAPDQAPAAPKAPSEVVDAAMAHNLTLARDMKAADLAAIQLRAEPTAGQLFAVQDIPTVDVMKKAVDLVGEAEFTRRAEARIAAAVDEGTPLPHGESTLIEAEARAIVAADRARAGLPEPVTISEGEMADFLRLARGEEAPPVGQATEVDFAEFEAAVVPRPAPAPTAPDLGRLADAFTKARAAFDEHLAEGGTLESFVGKRDLAPEVKNIVVGLHETAQSPARQQALTEQLAQRAKTGQGKASATADAVEATRALTDEQLTNTPKPVKPSADPLLDSVQARADELELAEPNRPVRLTEEGRRVTIADEMARVRREALEGTDTQLGSLDADLIRVAADCALSLGGV